MRKLANLDGLEGKFLTVGLEYEIFHGVFSFWVYDDEGDLTEVSLSNFN